MRKHYVLGFVFNYSKNQVLLIEKQRPAWQMGRWNGIGGEIEEGETPYQAMVRESVEETGFTHPFICKIIFTCPGGTVYVFDAKCSHTVINFNQIEEYQWLSENRCIDVIKAAKIIQNIFRKYIVKMNRLKDYQREQVWYISRYGDLLNKMWL